MPARRKAGNTFLDQFYLLFRLSALPGPVNVINNKLKLILSIKKNCYLLVITEFLYTVYLFQIRVNTENKTKKTFGFLHEFKEVT